MVQSDGSLYVKENTETTPASHTGHSRAEAFWRSPLLRALGALLLVLVLGFTFHAEGAFRHWGTHRDMLRQLSVYGILACGMTLVIVAGGIDLSVGSVLAMG